MNTASDSSKVWLITGASSGLGRALAKPRSSAVIEW